MKGGKKKKINKTKTHESGLSKGSFKILIGWPQNHEEYEIGRFKSTKTKVLLTFDLEKRQLFYIFHKKMGGRCSFNFVLFLQFLFFQSCSS